MAIEFETQVLDINKDEIANKMRQLGALEVPEVFQRRFIYDIKCLNSETPNMGEWIRLREVRSSVNGVDKIKAELTYKNRQGIGMDQTTEYEVEVSDFKEADKIIRAINFTSSIYYQENRRHKFILNNVEFCLDTWPQIPCFLEIEGKSEAAVKDGLALLGLTGKDAGHIGTINIYQRYGIDLHQHKELKF